MEWEGLGWDGMGWKGMGRTEFSSIFMKALPSDQPTDRRTDKPSYRVAIRN